MAKARDDRFSTCGEVARSAREAIAVASQDQELGGQVAASVVEPAAVTLERPPAAKTVIGPASATTLRAPDLVEVASEVSVPGGVTDVRAPEAGVVTVVGEKGPADREGSGGDVAIAGPETPSGTRTVDSKQGSSIPRSLGLRWRAVAVVVGTLALLVLGTVAAVALIERGGTTEDTAAPTNRAAPTITGTARAGSRLTARRGSWSNSPTSFAYQWRRCTDRGERCKPIADATSATYRLASSDVGRRLLAWVTASNDEGSKTRVTPKTRVIAAPFRPPSNISSPSVSGTPQQGQRLTASKGEWRGTGPISYTYVWKRCEQGGDCVAIQEGRGNDGRTYLLSSEDVGSTLRVEVIASNRVGRARMTSTMTPVVRAQAPDPTTPDPTTPDPTTPDPTTPDPTTPDPTTPEPCPPNCPKPPT